MSLYFVAINMIIAQIMTISMTINGKNTIDNIGTIAEANIFANRLYLPVYIVNMIALSITATATAISNNTILKVVFDLFSIPNYISKGFICQA